MITAGIDVGIENVKVVILEDGKAIGRSKGRSGGWKRLAATETALGEALRDAGKTAGDVSRTVATGKGKFDVASIAGDVITEPVAALKAAQFLCQEVTTVVDVGADETLVASVNEKGRIEQLVINEKCAAGVGSFLRNMARRLELSLADMDGLPPVAPDGSTVSDGCIVFGELDALNLLNNGVSAKEVASAVTASAVIRVTNSINDITVPRLDKVVLLGGLTKNTAFVKALNARSKIEFAIPEDAEYGGALGAALYAAGWGDSYYMENKTA
ncbi:MAG: acyl-CoA dehydratase activase [Clostridiales Family XIII bacterium]|jgi:benzoyl-CoA reductase subunit D|nr:acyl-CoA dehydratase activase [Clostridiales Family XIII bacterium]